MPPSAAPLTPARLLTWTALALMVIAAWDATGLDLPLTRAFGGPDGFALTHDWWLKNLLHNGAQRLGWALAALLALMVWRPIGALRALPRAERVYLLAGVLLAMLAVQALKYISLTSCPWSLAEFGGRAAYVSHWQWGVRDGGSGRCFPAGHASTGFCWLAGWFWLRPRAPRAARWWLAASLLAGLTLGAVQVARGAHYPSHVLWSGWVCWTVGGAFWLAVRALRGGRPLH
jgi:membrane-associated PAP2 superfamily phosphatase